MKTGPGLDVHITKRTALLLLLDIIATYLSYWLASILTNVKGEVFVNNEIYFVLGILAFINVVVLATFRLYNNLWEYASIDEVIQVVGATVLGTLGGAVFLWIIGTRLPIRVFVVSCFLLIFFMGGIRFVFRFMRQKGRLSPRRSAHATVRARWWSVRAKRARWQSGAWRRKTRSCLVSPSLPLTMIPQSGVNASMV